MPQPDPTREEALRRLDERLDKIEAARLARKRRFNMEGGASDGYRLLAELIGGVLGGLGFGWVFDQIANTAPWGLISGLLIGTGAAVFMIVRSAGRMSAKAKVLAGPVEPLVEVEDDDENDVAPGIFGPKQGD